MRVLVGCLAVAAVAWAAPLTEDAFVVPGFQVQNETPQDKFIRVDRNRDSIVNFDEFLHMDKVYEQAKKEEFDGIDKNKDGQITRMEYDDHYRELSSRSDNVRAKYFGQIFEDFDTNFDKSLSEEEVRQLLHDRFLVQPRQNFGQIFYGFDSDHSGGLDLFEYMKLDTNFPFEQTDPIRTAINPAQSNAIAEKVEKQAQFGGKFGGF